jgi:hypothetical protein
MMNFIFKYFLYSISSKPPKIDLKLIGDKKKLLIVQTMKKWQWIAL